MHTNKRKTTTADEHRFTQIRDVPRIDIVEHVSLVALQVFAAIKHFLTNHLPRTSPYPRKFVFIRGCLAFLCVFA